MDSPPQSLNKFCLTVIAKQQIAIFPQNVPFYGHMNHQSGVKFFKDPSDGLGEWKSLPHGNSFAYKNELNLLLSQNLVKIVIFSSKMTLLWARGPLIGGQLRQKFLRWSGRVLKFPSRQFIWQQKWIESTLSQYLVKIVIFCPKMTHLRGPGPLI